MLKKEYYYGLDQLRAALMLIGVLIHTVALVNTFYQWNYVSAHYRQPWLHDLVYVTHFFRMEAFFMIAGFFSAMVLIKKGRSYFLEGRARRVLLPLVSSVLLINTFEVWFVVSHGIKTWHEIGLSDFIVHSWFLLTLMLLSLLCLLPVDKWLDWLARQKWWCQAGLLVFYMFVPYGIRFVFTRVLGPTDDFPQFYSLLSYLVERTLHYSVYFFLGYQLYRSEHLKRCLADRKVYFAAAAVAAVGLLFQYSQIGQMEGKQPMVAYAAMLLVMHMTALAVSWVLFGFFFKAHFRASRWSAFLVRSAIIIYLFHHPLVIVLGYYFDIPGLTATGYFLLVTAAVYAGSFAIYFLIDSNRLTRTLFGIK